MGERVVQIVVVGDPGVGKSSLVLNLVQDFQATGIPAKARPIFLPVVNHNRLKIIDTSSKSGDVRDVDAAIKEADFVCILYDTNVPKTRDNVDAVWIPRIKRIREGLMTLLAVVGTKYDLNEVQLEEFENYSSDLINKNAEIEFILESSSKDNRASIEGIFERAQEAVLFPLSPLCDTNSKLHHNFLQAIKRIFYILKQKSKIPEDVLDSDDIISLRTINDIKPSEESVKLDFERIEEGEEAFSLEKYSCITKENEDGVRFITLEGLIVFFRLMISEEDAISVWTLLRKYGYETSFLIKNDYCIPKINNKDKTRKLALTDEAFGILHRIFEAHCDENKFLNKNALQKIFSPIPSVIDFHSSLNFNYLLATDWAETTDPWGSLSFPYCCAVQYQDNDDYKIDEASFKAMWMLGTSVDYQVVLKHFAYLGYSMTQGHNLSKYNSLSSSSLLHVSIFGQNGSGKSSLIYAQREATTNPTSTEVQRNVQRVQQQRNMELAFRNDKRNYGIHFHPSKDKWLALEELTERDQNEYLNEKKDKNINVSFDLAIFMCDQSNITSCQNTTQLLQRFLALEIKKPYQIVLSKSDLLVNLPTADKKKAENHFDSLGFPSISISKNQDLNPFFSTIIQKAIQGYVPPFEWNFQSLGVGIAISLILLLGISLYLTRPTHPKGTSLGRLALMEKRGGSVWLE